VIAFVRPRLIRLNDGHSASRMLERLAQKIMGKATRRSRLRALVQVFVRIGEISRAARYTIASERAASAQDTVPSGAIAGSVTVAKTGQPIFHALVSVVGTILQTIRCNFSPFAIATVPEGSELGNGGSLFGGYR